jgi:hypothetical protein
VDLTRSAFLGEPDWRWLGMRAGAVFPLQIGAVLLGMIGSFVLVQRVSERDHPDHTNGASLPWHVVVAGLAALAIWIIAQPMEMRGTGLGG